MTDGQDPDVFKNEAYYLRDELVDMGEVFNDDSILDIVLEKLTDEYLKIKCSAEADDDFTLDRAVITMRNIYANRAMRNGPLRKAKGRESAMVVTSTPSAVVTCSRCKKPGHRFQNCFQRKGKMSGKKPPPTPRKKSSCSLHNTDRHGNSDCRSQIRDDNVTRRPCPDQQNGRHNNTCSADTNTATTPTSTTQMEAYVPVTHAPSTTAAATTAATCTSSATSPCPNSPPVGIGYSVIAAPPINIAAQPVDFSMTPDSGASSHFVDKQLLPGIEHKINHNVQLDPPVTINVAGNHRLYGVGQGVLFVEVLDHIGSKHSVQLPVTVVPGLSRYLFSGGSAAARGVTISSPRSRIWTWVHLLYPYVKTATALLCIISTSPLVLPAEHLRQRFRPFLAKTLSRKPSSLFMLRRLPKRLPCLKPFQLISGTRGWAIPMGR